MPKAAPQPPPGPAPAQIDPGVVRKVKRSTAYLRVTLHNGTMAEGSGFFGAEPNIVLTNAHVLGMLQADGRLPRAVEVIASSGEPDEVRMAGRVLGVDRDSDLAVLHVQGDRAPVPPPLTVGTAANLTELQKLFIFGFPFGAQLGKNITITESSVSSLRRAPDGSLHEVQVNGGMHPGNSGGPVTDTRGVVVGVAVSGIRGTQINFAIPADFVKAVLEGRVAESYTGEPYLDQNQQKLPLRLLCLDPLQRIREVRVEVWTGDPGRPRPAGAAPAPQPGDGPRQTVPAVYRNSEAIAEVPLSALPEGKVHWLQPVVSGAGGTARYGTAISFRPTVAVALERRPALLQLKYPSQGQSQERTLKIKSSTRLTMADGKKSKALADHFEAVMLEVVSGDPSGGAAIMLPWGNCRFFSDIGGKQVLMSEQAHATVVRFPPRFGTSREGALKSRSDPNIIRSLGGELGETVDEMYQRVCNAFEATCLSAPGRQVNPLDNWQTRQPMLVVLSGGKTEVADMFLTCTLQGVRANGGRSEAYFNLVGQVKGRDQKAASADGKVIGYGLFDLEQGFLSEVKLRISSDLDLGGELRLAVTNDIELSRSAGNPLGIKPPPPQPAPVPVAKGKVIFSGKGALTTADPLDPKKRRYKLQPVQMVQGKRYVIEMNQVPGSKLDPYLQLVDARGTMVAFDDDGGGNLNARIVFMAPRTEVYRIMATSYHPNEVGLFALTVSEVAGP
ncbi:MAG: serine protease [Gemmataceae bacterium]|nr:serine protease [Gemmataceae bacterium]